MKCYAACASGKWLLKPSFLEESAKHGYFVHEEPHEWTAEDCGSLKKAVLNVASAARLCRQHLAERRKTTRREKEGLFSGFKVVCFLDLTQTHSWKTIIHAGGGVVVDLKPPFQDKDLKVTLSGSAL